MSISEFVLNKIIKKYENEFSKHDYDKCKMVDFIIYLFDNLTKNNSMKKLVDLIYTEHHEYNKHPFTYEGIFSKSKMIIHLLNQDNSYLLWLIKQLIDYNGENNANN